MGNVHSPLRNVHSPLRNIRSPLWNIKRIPYCNQLSHIVLTVQILVEHYKVGIGVRISPTPSYISLFLTLNSKAHE